MAISSNKMNVKIYSLCSSLKILPVNYKQLKENKKDKFEISNKKLNNVNIINYYYDITDLKYLFNITQIKSLCIFLSFIYLHISL